MPKLRMRLDLPSDLPLVLALVTEVSAWLAERHIDQWPSPPGLEVRQSLAREIGAGDVYLAEWGDTQQAIGMLRFEWHDAELWPQDPDGAGYVHSFLVQPGYHGQAVGAAMLSWAADQARARGR